MILSTSFAENTHRRYILYHTHTHVREFHPNLTSELSTPTCLHNDVPHTIHGVHCTRYNVHCSLMNHLHKYGGTIIIEYDITIV